MVRSDRGYPAPVVEPRLDEAGEHPRAQVRRRLDARVRPQHEPRHRDGPQMILERRLRGRGHRRTGLRPEVLHDHFLDVAVPFVDVPNGEQRLDPLAPGLSDPDQDAGGERHRQRSRPLQSRKPDLGVLVRRPVVRPPLLAQPARRRLEHDARRHRDFAQTRKLLALHDPGVHMGQEAGLLVHAPRGMDEIVDGGLEAHPGEGLARRPVPPFGLVAQREQRLRAPGLGAPARDIDRLVHGEIGRADVAGGLGEGAVAAHVATELRERDEYLG